MLASNVPPKFPVPFASGAGSADIRAIPVPSQITTLPGAASLTDGFPPLNFTAIAAGGIPPFGQDFNGIFNQITKWNQWHAAGGPVRYDATFATAIGGYPSGALVESNSGHAIYESVADNNTADPNAGGALWKIIACAWSASPVQATGSANIQVISLSPAPTSLAQLIGIPLQISSQGINTGPVTINPNGLGVVSLLWSGGIQLSAGVLTTKAPFAAVYDGTEFVLLSPSPIFTDPGTFGVAIDGTASSRGANLALRGNGTTTPNKFIRAFNGLLTILNSAYTTAIATMDDSGNLLTAGTIGSTGNITANSGKLRAGVGATGSGDPNAATILGDFVLSGASTGLAQTFPTGCYVQGGNIAVGGGVAITTLDFPKQFLHGVSAVMVNEGHAAGMAAGQPTWFGASDPNITGVNVYCLVWNGSAWAVPPGPVSCNWMAIGS